MGRRSVSDKGRGLQDWEARHNPELRMTVNSMNQALTKIQQERFNHSRKLSKISNEEKQYR